MAIDSITTAGTAHAAAASNPAPQKPKAEEIASGKGWTFDDVVAIATNKADVYSLTYRPNMDKIKFVHIDPQRPRHGGKAVVLSERDVTGDELYKVWNGPADTMSAMGEAQTAPDTRSRKVLEDFADRQPAAFEAFVRESLENGADEGTDFKETFFQAKAGAERVAGYESMKAEDSQWALASDKAGRYLAQHGVDVNQPLALTRLDDGSYANINDHPQKHYVEHLVNTNKPLFDKIWEQYHSAPGSIFPIHHAEIRPGG